MNGVVGGVSGLYSRISHKEAVELTLTDAPTLRKAASGRFVDVSKADEKMFFLLFIRHVLFMEEYPNIAAIGNEVRGTNW